MFKDIDIKFVNKEITPFGGLSLFFKMLEKCGFEQDLQACGLPEQGSNRGYKPWQLIYGLFAGVWCGACKFGHLDLVRYDRVLSKMSGWDPGPGNIPNEEPEVFFYHSDHLGSASWITDASGKPIQHLQYLPYGEPYVDQRSSGYNERFTFTGKERDEETGYGYFGARYMDHELMTMWLSVDPVADKYPGISPYAYCAWNPVKLVDPDGREVNPIYDFKGNHLGNTKEGFTGEPIICNPESIKRCMDFYEVSNISELSKDQVLSAYGETFDAMEKKGGLSSQAQENIFTDIVSKMEGTKVNNYTFSMQDIGGRIKYYSKTNKNPGNIGTNVKTGTIYINHQYEFYETTVENIQSSVVYHEWIGHIIMGWGNGNQNAKASDGGTHYMCYLSVMSSPLFKATTKSYQDFNIKMFNYFFQ